MCFVFLMLQGEEYELLEEYTSTSIWLNAKSMKGFVFQCSLYFQFIS